MSHDQEDQPTPEKPPVRRSKAVVAVAIISVVVLAVVLTLAAVQSRHATAVPFDIMQAADQDEKPFYTIDARATGPLTLSELQINLPAELAKELTPSMQTCYIEKIGELAAEAGDPETLRPTDVAYLPTDGSWAELTVFDRRLILAQAIVSRAILFC